MTPRILPLLAGAVLFTASAFAAPVVSGALNTASYALPALPNGSLAQGSMIAIFGTGLGPASLTQASTFPLPTDLGGTSAKIVSGGTTSNLILTYTSAGQIGAIIPSTTPVGTGQLTVTYSGSTSANFAVSIVKSSFGVFTANQRGTGPGIVQNYVSATDTPVNSILRSAKPGQTMILWGTGLGPIAGSDAGAPPAGDLNVALEVLIGGKTAPIRYKGRSGCCSGVDQIVFDIPQGVLGCYVPVVVKTGDIVSNSSFIAITQNGGRCADGTTFTDADLQKVQNGGTLSIGSVNLSRIGTKIDLGSFFGGVQEIKLDVGAAAFYRYNAAQLEASSFAAQSSITPGSCYTFSSSDQETSMPADPVTGTPLDAGAKITVTGPAGTKDMTPQPGVTGVYSGSFYTGTPSIPGIPSSGSPFLEAGAYTASNGAGATVGGFTTQLTIPGNFTWTNESSVTNITRSAGQLFTWSGAGANTLVFIMGSSYDANNKVSGGFYCLENGSAGRFTVPASTLLYVPKNAGSVSTGGFDTPTGFLGIGVVGNPVRFSASNLDIGIFDYSSISMKSVNFQ